MDTGEFRLASEWLAAQKQLSQGDRVLRAHLELELGDAAAAQTQVAALLRERLDTRSRAYCLSIEGKALGRLGDSEGGLCRLRKAVSLAATTDPYMSAELLAQTVTALLSWIGIEPASAELGRLRKAALATGNTYALIEYHIINGTICAMREWLQRADAESRIASALLDVAPHRTQLYKVMQLQANIAIKACDMTGAREYSQQCLLLAEEHGSPTFVGGAFGNLAHIASITGNYDEARKLLNRTLELLEPRSALRAGAYATGLEAALAVHDDSLAAAMILRGEELQPESSREQHYNRLFFEVQRVRWLVYAKRFAEAATAATAALGPIAKLADSNLLNRMRLLAAEAQAAAGSKDLALRNFSDVCSSLDDSSLETFAELNRVAALLTADTDGQISSACLSRAWRLLTSAGLLGIRAGIERTAADIGIREEELTKTRDNDTAGAIQTVAWALQLGKHPRQLDSEVTVLVDLLAFTESARLIESGTPLEMAADRVSSDREPVLGEGVNAKMLRRAVQQVVRAANAAAAHRISQEQQVGLWPVETWPNQLGLVVAAESMVDLVAMTRRLAPSKIPVLITGETGTGKELLARALHDASPRKDKPFIPFNCNAIGRDMLDAQLFGYRRGAFTGAQEAFPGVIRAAGGGTLFLDEIGELTPEVQPKLLRFLESGEIHPLGEPKPITVDVRVVAATNANLEQLVADGRFREDLFYRLNVVRLPVPPLRERREEIPPLAQHYLDKYSREAQRTGLRLAEETMEYLILYRWPGNVRQLANEIRRLVALAESGAVLMPEHLSQEISSSRRTIPAAERNLAPTEFIVRMDQPMSAATEHLERSMIQYALKRADHRFEDAAQLLGLSRKGLYLKRQRLGIVEPNAADSEIAADDAAPEPTPALPGAR
jgi:DNA-binding NtrC family response regulator